MRHKKNTKKFKRTQEERRRLKIDLARGLINSTNGQIITFTARAKWFKPFFERLVTYCKRAGDDKQLAYKRLTVYFDKPTAQRMIEKIAPKFTKRSGGYVRILKYQEPFSTLDKSIVSLVE